MAKKSKHTGQAQSEGKPTPGSSYHVPVLYYETLDALAIRPDGVYVDCTFGGGGHSRGILERLGPNGRLVAFDQDADAAANLPQDQRLLFVPENFRHMYRFLRLHGISRVDGILADLGVSSHQFDEADRGFAYRYQAALDMRMDRRQPTSAATILNSYDAPALQQIFSQWGEVTNSRTLAETIVQARQLAPLHTIQQLLDVMQPLVKGNKHRYYAQVFQALRMAVNDEMGALHDWLGSLHQVLQTGSRVAVITFHSVEDRMVKQFFKQGSWDTQDADPIYGGRQASPFRLVNKKPIEASPAELQQNDRARSARLRVAEWIGT